MRTEALLFIYVENNSVEQAVNVVSNENQERKLKQHESTTAMQLLCMLLLDFAADFTADRLC
jgi:hypothetical protein